MAWSPVAALKEEIFGPSPYTTCPPERGATRHSMQATRVVLQRPVLSLMQGEWWTQYRPCKLEVELTRLVLD